MSPHLEELTSKQAIQSDNTYYQYRTITDYSSTNTDFIVKSYDMNISVGNGLENDIKMNIQLNSTTDKLIFSLYHNFKVTSIRYLNSEIPFEQDVDYLTVNFPRKLDPYKNYELTINYEGYGPQRFFSNDQAIMLPGFFSWYPVPGNHPTADFHDQTIFYTFDSKQPVQYNMKYTGPTPIFTNLDYQSNNSWSGRSSSGITLVSGEMEEVKVDKTIIIRPYALYNMNKDLEKDVSSFIDLYGNISEILGQSRKDINKIFLLETRLNQSPIRIEDGYAIFNVNVGNNNVFTLSDYLIQSVVEGVVNNYAWETQDRTMKDLFKSSFSYWYEQKEYKVNKNESLLMHQFSPMVDSFFPQYKSTFNKLVEFMDLNQNNEQKIHSFFTDWLDSLKSKEDFNWNILNEIITNSEWE
jgi:hypothetical protein